jgi:hypothetical protein
VRDDCGRPLCVLVVKIFFTCIKGFFPEISLFHSIPPFNQKVRHHSTCRNQQQVSSNLPSRVKNPNGNPRSDQPKFPHTSGISRDRACAFTTVCSSPPRTRPNLPQYHRPRHHPPSPPDWRPTHSTVGYTGWDSGKTRF